MDFWPPKSPTWSVYSTSWGSSTALRLLTLLRSSIPTLNSLCRTVEIWSARKWHWLTTIHLTELKTTCAIWWRDTPTCSSSPTPPWKQRWTTLSVTWTDSSTRRRFSLWCSTLTTPRTYGLDANYFWSQVTDTSIWSQLWAAVISISVRSLDLTLSNLKPRDQRDATSKRRTNFGSMCLRCEELSR